MSATVAAALKKIAVAIIDEYEPTEAFDEDLFNQIIEKAVVMSGSEIAFHLIGGLRLIETIA